jgi:hypothetical protein
MASALIGDFMPLALGNWWKYQGNFGVKKKTVTSVDTVFDPNSGGGGIPIGKSLPESSPFFKRSKEKSLQKGHAFTITDSTWGSGEVSVSTFVFVMSDFGSLTLGSDPQLTKATLSSNHYVTNAGQALNRFSMDVPAGHFKDVIGYRNTNHGQLGWVNDFVAPGIGLVALNCLSDGTDCGFELLDFYLKPVARVVDYSNQKADGLVEDSLLILSMGSNGLASLILT